MNPRAWINALIIEAAAAVAVLVLYARLAI